MKNISIITFILALSLQSCDNSIKPYSNIEDFDVSVLSSTIELGQEAVFSFSGNPDIIYFYSDEMFSQYEYRNGRTAEVLETNLSFFYRQPVYAPKKTDALSVLLSTNYTDTNNDYADLIAAEWVDITDKFGILVDTDGYVSAETVNLDELIEDGEPFFIAFRYVNDLDDGRAGISNIQSFSLSAELETGMIELGTMADAGFRIVEQYPEFPSRSSVTATTITLRGGTDNSVYTRIETWAISRAFAAGKIEYGPDRPLPIKGLSSDIEDFTYMYEEPGVYNALFFAKNATIDMEEEGMKEIIITVTE